MFDQLLESRRRRDRRVAVAAGSIAAHVAIVTVASLATARAIPPVRSVAIVERPIWASPPPAPPTGAAPRTRAEPPRPVEGPRHGFAPPRIDIDVESPSMPTGPSIDIRDVIGAELGGRDAGPASGSGAPTTALPGGVFSVGHVDRVAALRPGSTPPRYPAVLRAASIEGRVELRFVVDTLGRVEPGSAIVLASTDPLFTAAVEAALPRLRFTPALHRGRPVRMLVQMPFEFRIEGR